MLLGLWLLCEFNTYFNRLRPMLAARMKHVDVLELILERDSAQSETSEERDHCGELRRLNRQGLPGYYWDYTRQIRIVESMARTAPLHLAAAHHHLD